MTHASLSLVGLPLTAAVLAVALAPHGPAAQAAGLCLLTAALLLGLRSHLGVVRLLSHRLLETRRRAQKRQDAAETARRQLAEQLQEEQDAHRDAFRDARRHRLAALDATFRIRLGERQITGSLVDLSFQEVWLRVPTSTRPRWVQGLPVRLSVVVDGAVHPLGWAEAAGTPTARGLLRLQWTPSLSEVAVPRAVWRAMAPREAHRVPGDGVRATLHTPSGPRHADVQDLSASGIALRVGLGRREVGELRSPVELTLDLGDGRSVPVPCHLRHVTADRGQAMLGLAFDPESAAFADLQNRIAAFVLQRSTERIAVREAS